MCIPPNAPGAEAKLSRDRISAGFTASTSSWYVGTSGSAPATDSMVQWYL